MAVELIELYSPFKPLEPLELDVAYVDRSADNPGEGGAVRISADPENIIERRPDGLFAAPKLASAQW